MPNYKNFIKIRSEEKELYRIFKELELYGRSSFTFDDKKKQQGIARSIGIRGKSLCERDLFNPPAIARRLRLNIVTLPIGVEIKEKKGRGSYHFLFKRKSIR